MTNTQAVLLALKTVLSLPSSDGEQATTMTTNEFIDKMQEAYKGKTEKADAILPNGRAIRRYLKAISDLNLFGINIKFTKHKGIEFSKPCQITSKQALALATIVDACAFIGEQQAEELYTALGAYISPDDREDMSQQVYVDSRKRYKDDPTLNNAEVITKAITKGCYISYKKDSNESEDRTVLMPIKLVHSFGYFYLEAQPKLQRGRPRNDMPVLLYRLDRMHDVELDEYYKNGLAGDQQARREILAVGTKLRTSQTFDAFRYEKLLYLVLFYTADKKTVKDDVEAHFGISDDSRSVDNTGFVRKVSVFHSPTFFRWVFGWEGEVCILDPSDERIPEGFFDEGKSKGKGKGKDNEIELYAAGFDTAMNGFKATARTGTSYDVSGYRKMLIAECKRYGIMPGELDDAASQPI